MKIVTLDKANKGEMELPGQFKEEIRPDLIKKVCVAIQNNQRQPYGADPEAGKRVSAEISRRRREYRGSYGYGISRVPRKIIIRRGTRMHWMGALMPGTVGGRRAHPPKASKSWKHKINRKEKRKAIRSALSATMVRQLIERRGHNPPENFPFIVDSQIESLTKTKQVIETLNRLGFQQELNRVGKRKLRAGKGKVRGRKYKTKKGPLLVVSGKCPLQKAAANIPGTEVVRVDKLNVQLLAPGAQFGRLTLFSEAAIQKIKQGNLFTNQVKKQAKVSS